MKLHVFFFAVSTFAAKKTVDEAAIRKMASDQLKECEFLLAQILRYESNINKQINDVKKSDFGLGKQSKIVGIQKMVNQRNSPICKKNLETHMQNLKREFQDLVLPQLTSLLVNFTSFRNTLTQIKRGLSGPRLTKEISLCKQSSHCSVRHYNPTAISNIKQYLVVTEQIVPNRMFILMKQYVDPIISERAHTAVHVKVSACLAGLKESKKNR